MLKAFVLGCSVALLGTIGTAGAQDWTKSKWGPNDEIGAANYMTPELVVKAASLIKTVKTYALGIPVDSKTPAYPPRTFKLPSSSRDRPAVGLGPARRLTTTTFRRLGWHRQPTDGPAISVSSTSIAGNKLADFADPTGRETRHRKSSADGGARGVLPDMAAFTTLTRQGGTAFNEGNRGSREEARRRNSPGRCRDLPHRLA
jgi:hypothetical protein